MELISGQASGGTVGLAVVMGALVPEQGAAWPKPTRAMVVGVGAAALAAGLALLILLFVRESGEKRFSEIRVEGNHYLSREEVLLLSGLEGRAALSGTERRLVQRRLEAHAAVTGAVVSFQDDGTLLVKLAERACAAQVRDAASGRLYDVDAGLAILGSGEVRCRNVPIVSGAFRPEGNRFEEPRLAVVMGGLARVGEVYPDLLLRISEVRARRDGTTDLYLVSSRLRIVIAGRFEGNVVHRLFAAVAYLEKENLRKGTLDLRGRDAVFAP